MRMTIDRLTSLVIVAAAAALVGWGCGGSSSGGADGGVDGKSDATDSGGADRVIGTGGSAGGTGGAGPGGSGTGGKADASMDTPADQSPADADAGADAKPDAPADVRADAPADLADAPLDVPADAVSDAASEAMPEAAPDAEPETAPAPPDAAMEAAPEAGTDAAASFVSIDPCVAAGNYVTTPTTIAFRTGPNGYEPACLKVTKGATVTWTGDFDAAVGHPLEPRAGGTSDNPITLTDTDVGSKAFTFPKAGFFPYHCRRHADMIGVIWVSD